MEVNAESIGCLARPSQLKIHEASGRSEIRYQTRKPASEVFLFTCMPGRWWRNMLPNIGSRDLLNTDYLTDYAQFCIRNRLWLCGLTGRNDGRERPIDMWILD